MKAVNDRILCRVNMAQKDRILLGGIEYKTALKWEVNYREKSPVVAQVVAGNHILQEGDIIITHHNHFMPNGLNPSRFYVQDDLFSIPFNQTIFAKIKPDGSIDPICGNVLGDRIPIETVLPIPVEERKKYIDRIKVTHGGTTKFRSGDLVFTRPNLPYDIVYFVDGIEKRVTKIDGAFVVGVVKKYYAKS